MTNEQLKQLLALYKTNPSAFPSLSAKPQVPTAQVSRAAYSTPAFAAPPPQMSALNAPQVIPVPKPANQPTQPANVISGASSARGLLPTTPSKPNLAQFGASLGNIETQAKAIQEALNKRAASETVPQVSQIPQVSEYEKLQENYLKGLAPSEQESGLNTRINALLGGTESSNILVGGEPISAGAIEGRRAALTRETQAQLVPLQRQLGLEQAKRQAAMDVSKERLGFEEKREEARATARKPITLAPGTTYFDPITGKPIYQASDEIAKQKLALDERKFNEDIRQFGMEYALKNKGTDGGGGGEGGEASPYQTERAARTVQSVNELLTKAKANPGIFGKSAALPVPLFLRTEAFRNFESELDTLKANIAFGELTAMREAAKTGGALGQVSDKEAKLLESSLGALNMSQSPENFQAQLNKIRASIERWQEAVGLGDGEAENPQIRQLKDAGYSDEQIQQIINS